jgi:hypothetical protein
MSFVCCKTSRVLVWLGGSGLLAAGVLAAFYFAGWFNPLELTGSQAPVIPPKPVEDLPVPVVRFTNVTGPAGIHFHHTNGATPLKLLPETMGAGVVVLDFDNDGRPDLLFLNGCPWPGQEKPGAKMPTLALYRNKGDGTFEDVTVAAGLDRTFFGMGGTAGDYDNDHFPDLFLTGVGGNHLFRNEPDPNGANGRRFREVTATAGVGGPGGWPAGPVANFFDLDRPLCFSTSAAFLDYDGDARLDLFVCNYVTWSPEIDKVLGSRLDGKERRYSQPTLFKGAQCFLYRNKGDGTFEDVSKSAGVEVFEPEGIGEGARLRTIGKCLGMVVCDADGDGWPDVVVANDTVRNFFFHNVERNGKRVFEEKGLPVGVAYAEGRARGAMGIDWAPWYRPRCNALLIGNFADEPDTFLCQDDPTQLQFADVARAEGIAGPSRTPLKFGVLFLDYDLDGRLDFLTCNGHLDPGIGDIQKGQTYEQAPQLYWNTGEAGRGFQEVKKDTAGSDLFEPLVGRGCAYLDYNGDGAPDVVLTANGGPARLLRNDNKLGNHWVRLKLEGDGVRSNTSAIGAVVTLEAGGRVQRREIASARGYLSASELVATFGLGKAAKVDRVTIRWPGRKAGTQVIEGEKIVVDKEQTIRQGDR